MIKQYTNNIFEVITHLDKKDYDYFKSLSEEEFKEMQPYTLMKWLSHIQDNKKTEVAEYYTLMVNELVNKHFWEMSKYKDLQLQLLCACGSGQWTKHGWLKAKTKSKKDKFKDEIRKFYHFLTDEEFEMKYSSLNQNEKNEILENLGLKEEK